MVRIDPRTVRNDLAQREAELKAALSRREIARSQMTRAEALLARGTFTQLDLEQAALDLANAEADVVAAQVSVENSRIAVDDTDVRAPITGTVIQKPVERGQVISSPTRDVAGGSPLMQMADLSEVQIRALIDETDIGKIRPGMTARVAVAAYPNQPFPGEVVKIEPQAVVEQNVTMFAVLVSIDNRQGLLMPGMNAEVDVSIARSEDVVTIPVMALRTNRDIASTAVILGIEETDLRAMLKSAGGGGQRPAEAAGRSEPRKGSKTDYRFCGNVWVVMDTGGEPEGRKIRTGITDLDRVEKNPMGYQDLKPQKFMSLGPKSYREALSLSPAEPGLARALEISDTVVSTGGWSDLEPSLVLKNLGCEQVIVITRQGRTVGFGADVSRQLGMTDEENTQMFDPGNPESSVAVSLGAADGIWCTNWDGVEGFDFAGAYRDAYLAPLQTTSDYLTGAKSAYGNISPSLDLVGCTAGLGECALRFRVRTTRRGARSSIELVPAAHRRDFARA